jgi:hypothetical protein
VLRLDDPAIRQSVAAAPDAMIAGLPEPIVLDEWQAVPEILGAVKRSVDAALVAAVLGLSQDTILYGPDMLGRLLDTFVRRSSAPNSPPAVSSRSSVADNA